VSWDYKLLDEQVMERDPFYCEFLPVSGMRYFISAILEQTPDKVAPSPSSAPAVAGELMAVNAQRLGTGSSGND